MRFAIIENGVVTNIAVADEPLADNWCEVGDGCNIGDLWDGENFTPPGPSEEEIAQAWVALRSRRDGLLVLSDWTMLPDAPVTDAQRLAWAGYRQALRDLPDGITDPLHPVWPEAPSSIG